MDVQDVLEPAETESAAKKKEMQPISVSRKRFGYAERTLYRVYTTATHFELVEAESAHEAFEKGGVDEPYKIERELFYRYVAIPPDLVNETEDDERVETDIRLPEPGEKEALLTAALDMDEYEASLPQFENVELGELHSTKEPEEVFIEPATEDEPETPTATAEPQPEPEPEKPDVGDSEELSPEEVEALLNSDS